MKRKILFSNRAVRGYCTFLWLLTVGLICLNNYPSAPSSSAEDFRKSKSTGASVNGSIHFRLPQQVGEGPLSDRKLPRLINLAGFKVYLKNVNTGEESAPEVTDHYGRYMFPRQKPGKYELRWRQQAGWAEGHHPEKLVIESMTLYPTAAEVTPLPHTSVLAGRVKLADGTSPFFDDEFFGVEQAAQVAVLDNHL
jgi:hypothetical protein